MERVTGGKGSRESRRRATSRCGVAVILVSVWLAGLSRGFADAAAAAEGSDCRLTIRITDEATREEWPAIIRLRDESGRYAKLGDLVDRCTGLPGEARDLGWLAWVRPVEVRVPRGKYTVEAVAGLESVLERRELDLTGQAEARLDLRLRRIADPREDGWVAGNTHLHLRNMTKAEADRYLTEVPAADGLDIVFLSYLERAIVDRAYTSNQYTTEDLRALTRSSGIRFGNGEEHRHNFGQGGEGYGHVLLLNLSDMVRPVSFGPGVTQRGTDGRNLREGLKLTRKQDGTVIWCHGAFGFEVVPNWLDGFIDAQNIFDGGNRGGYEEVYYRYLNLGLRVPFSAGTDWFIYDFSRAYVPLGPEMNQPGGASLDDWLTGLKQGKSYITNSALLEFSVDDRSAGETIALAQRGELTIKGRAIGRHNFGKLQLIHNGKVDTEVSARKMGDHFEAKMKAVVSGVDVPCWLALRIQPDRGMVNELNQPLFAHTSAVYVDVNGKGVFDPGTAEVMVAEMEAGIRQIEEQGVFESDTERERTLSIYLEGISLLNNRLEAARSAD